MSRLWQFLVSEPTKGGFPALVLTIPIPAVGLQQSLLGDPGLWGWVPPCAMWQQELFPSAGSLAACCRLDQSRKGPHLP